jgi:hypothetical protein
VNLALVMARAGAIRHSSHLACDRKDRLHPFPKDVHTLTLISANSVEWDHIVPGIDILPKRVLNIERETLSLSHAWDEDEPVAITIGSTTFAGKLYPIPANHGVDGHDQMRPRRFR